MYSSMRRTTSPEAKKRRFQGAIAWLVGEEGRGVATILEMVALDRPLSAVLEALVDLIDARIPGALIGLALASAAVVLLRLESRGVSVLGTISVGMPAFTSSAVSVDSGNGTYQSPNFTPAQAGIYRWIATYSGDLNNDGVAGACNESNESSQVKAAPSIDTDGELPAGDEGRLYFEDSTGRGVVYPSDPAKTAAANLRPGVFTIGEAGNAHARDRCGGKRGRACPDPRADGRQARSDVLQRAAGRVAAGRRGRPGRQPSRAGDGK